MAKKIDESTLAILSRVTIDGNLIVLTCGQLDRKQYIAVNEILEHIGGKWNRKQKAHVFASDPTEALEAVLLEGEIIPPQDYGYFPTPEGLAEQVVRRAEIRPGMVVLEPSAGQGALAEPAARIVGPQNVHCHELLDVNCEVLEGKGHLVLRGDFLAVAPKPLYLRVIMNPPFERQQDIDHVMHAWACLAPRGRLVSIVSGGAMFRENRKTTAFRELVNEHGSIERLPEGSFKESGTGVNTALVVMDKP